MTDHIYLNSSHPVWLQGRTHGHTSEKSDQNYMLKQNYEGQSRYYTGCGRMSEKTRE